MGTIELFGCEWCEEWDMNLGWCFCPHCGEELKTIERDYDDDN